MIVFILIIVSFILFSQVRAHFDLQEKTLQDKLTGVNYASDPIYQKQKTL